MTNDFRTSHLIFIPIKPRKDTLARSHIVNPIPCIIVAVDKVIGTSSMSLAVFGLSLEIFAYYIYRILTEIRNYQGYALMNFEQFTSYVSPFDKV